MRRVLLVLAVAAIAVSGTLIYLGARGHGTPTFEGHLTDLGTNPTTSVLLPEGTWTFGSGPAGFAVGGMYITGGPKRPKGAMPDNPLAGTVEVHHPGDSTVLEKVPVDATGRYRIDLPVGDYQLIGHAPSVGEKIDSQGFTIRVGATTSVDLVALAT